MNDASLQMMLPALLQRTVQE